MATRASHSHRRNGQRRRRLIGPAVLVALVLGVIAGLYAWHGHYLQAEDRILRFCRSQRPGRPIGEARRMAVKADLAATDERRAGKGLRILSVAFRSAVLPVVSACTLRHDGRNIVMVSYDPWYH